MQENVQSNYQKLEGLMRFTIISLAILFSSTAFGQNAQCTKRLTDAEEAFDQGRLQDVLSLLNKDDRAVKDCFSTFLQDEKIRAEKLLTKAYLFTDNPAEAEKSLVDLLHEDKEHQLAREDPAELHHLYSQFKTEPIIRLGVRFGVNKSLPIVIQEFTTFQDGNKKYNGDGVNTGLGIGFNVEALAERHIKNGIEVGLGVQFRIASFEVEGDLLQQDPASAGDLIYKVKNQSSMIRFPLLVRYNLNYDKKNSDGVRLKANWYAIAGGSFDYIATAKYVSTDRTGGTAFTLNDESGNLLGIGPAAVDQVARTNASIFGGLGVKLRMGREQVDFITFEVRYDNSLFNYVDPSNRYANKDVLLDIGHVEDDLALNTISFTVGYTRSFYKPSKRKQYR